MISLSIASSAELMLYLSMPMVQKALIVGVLISLCASILGVNLVLKRLSFIGDSLAHTAFGLMTVGAVIGMIDETIFALIATIIVSIFITRANTNGQIKGDALLSVLSVSSLGVGYLLLSKFSVSANLAADVCSTLFGSIAILTLSDFDVLLCIILSIIVILAYIVFYNKIFAVTFDEEFSKATGVKVGFYNLILSTILAVIVVLAINLVGSLLISALIIFPALSSMRVFNSFKAVVLSSSVIAILGSSLGIIASIIIDAPIGSTIVTVELIIFLIFCIIGKRVK